jgi:hypothetical protein
VATPLLCFPKADVVVSDLVPSMAPPQIFVNQDWFKQVSAIAGAISMLTAAVLLSLAPLQDSKLDPLLPTSSAGS